MIIDNFLPPEQFAKLQEAVFKIGNFPWFYVESASLKPEDNDVVDKFAVETDGFYHILYDIDTNNKSHKSIEFIDFYKELDATLGIRDDEILRSRMSLKFPKVGFTKDNYNLPHIDFPKPHKTIIYYLNDSDGDTILFDQHWSNYNASTEFTIKERVTPKANRLLLIDGLQYHTASNPIDSKIRIILNINAAP